VREKSLTQKIGFPASRGPCVSREGVRVRAQSKHDQQDEEDNEHLARPPTTQQEVPRDPNHYSESEEGDVSSEQELAPART
jgi:hypothetical protein